MQDYQWLKVRKIQIEWEEWAGIAQSISCQRTEKTLQHLGCSKRDQKSQKEEKQKKS